MRKATIPIESTSSVRSDGRLADCPHAHSEGVRVPVSRSEGGYLTRSMLTDWTIRFAPGPLKRSQKRLGCRDPRRMLGLFQCHLWLILPVTDFWL